MSDPVVEAVAREVYLRRSRQAEHGLPLWDTLPEQKRADLCYLAKLHIAAYETAKSLPQPPQAKP